MNRCLAALLVIAAIASALPAVQVKYEWRHDPGRELSLLADGKAVWILHFAAEDNWPYFHPLSLPGGPVLTGLAPADHPWHRALWFSWKYIDGVNYWEFADMKNPASQPAGRTALAGNEVIKTGEDGAVIVLDLAYRHAGTEVMKEKRTIRVGLPRADGSYIIDWQGVFFALGRDVELDKDTGYAGLFFRGSPRLAEPQYLNSEGIAGTEVHQKAARWIDLSGAADPAFGPAGVAIFDHPGNVRFPTTWWRDRSREDDEISYIGSAPLFTGPYKLPAGRTLTLRYRVLVHRGRPDAAALNREFEAFASSR